MLTTPDVTGADEWQSSLGSRPDAAARGQRSILDQTRGVPYIQRVRNQPISLVPPPILVPYLHTYSLPENNRQREGPKILPRNNENLEGGRFDYVVTLG